MPDVWSEVIDPWFRTAAKGGWVGAIVSMLPRDEEPPFHGPYTARGRLTGRYVPTGPVIGTTARLSDLEPMLWGTLDQPVGFYFGGPIELTIARRADGVTSTTMSAYDGYEQTAEGSSLLGVDEYFCDTPQQTTMLVRFRSPFRFPFDALLKFVRP
jgi:hypothetical protein